MSFAVVAEKFGALFGIKRGEFLKIFSLFFYLFFIVNAYVIAKTVRDALYISRFGAMKLPYVYICIALLAGLFVSIYLKLAQRCKQPLLLSATLIFFSGNIVLFWSLSRYHFSWLYPVIYIWAGIFGAIGPMQVWTLSNFILTTREAKRLYGFLGSGGILGGIAGGFLSSTLVPLIGTENLMLVIALLLVCCVPLVNLIWYRAEHCAIEAAVLPKLNKEHGPRNLRQSWSLITHYRYLFFIAAIISLGSLVTTIADWQFKAVADHAIDSKDALTAFFGKFYGYLGVAALLLQLFFTSRMMRRFGIGFTLLLLPIGLVFGSAVLILYMSLWTAILLKAPDQLFKHSIDRSTIELLYLPVPAEIKAGVKSFIDTIIWRLADGMAGVMLLLLTVLFPANVRMVSIINLGFIACWIAVAILIKREYLHALRITIKHEVGGRGLANKIKRFLDEQREARQPEALIENRLMRELREYYRTLMLLAACQQDGRSHEMLERCLSERQSARLERIFRLLVLCYEPHDLYYAYHGLRHSNAAIRANALELIENLLLAEHQRLLMPIIDEEIPLTERYAVGESLGLARPQDRIDALAQLAADHDPIVASYAHDAIKIERHAA